MTELVDYESQLRNTFGALPPHERALLIEILRSPDEGRAEVIGRLHRSSAPGVAELLMDLEEEPAARALVVGILKEVQRDAET